MTETFVRVGGAPGSLHLSSWSQGIVLFEIAAGLLDDDPMLRPQRHIMIEHKASWTTLADGLPAYDRPSLIRLRAVAASRR
ncbi:MAG: hypothetical protein RLZZ450_2367 [Pseudomonadota bacterium]|jgi:hypothetical protein